MKKSNTKEFIEKAQYIHTERYDYFLVEYINSRNKVKILCQKHGVFLQTPKFHLAGQGCPVCSGNVRLTTISFIQKAQEKHLDLYNYSLVNYINSGTKVKILCQEHGEFLQTPNNHLAGHGCPECAGVKKLTTISFIQKAQEKHLDLYNYSLVNYINSGTKVKILCQKHSMFKQTPNNHLAGQGCPACSGNVTLTTEEFIQKAQEKHLDLYNYSLVDIKIPNEKVKIICQKHGMFLQTPNNHLAGHGCQECGKISVSKKKKLTTILFIQRARERRGNKYDYSLVEYVNSVSKVKIVCQEHGVFEQIPSAHLAGQGCPKCAREKSNYERYKDKITTLYYIYFPEYNLYKIGITKSSVESRFKGDIENGLKIEIIQTKEFQDGYEAFLLEQKILNNFRDFRPTKEIAQAAIRVGWTELFTKDIFGLNSF